MTYVYVYISGNLHASLCATLSFPTAGGAFGATVWKANPSTSKLEAQAQLSGPSPEDSSSTDSKRLRVSASSRPRIHRALWQPGGMVATVEDTQVRCWNIGAADAKVGTQLQGQWLQGSPQAKAPASTDLPLYQRELGGRVA